MQKEQYAGCLFLLVTPAQKLKIALILSKIQRLKIHWQTKTYLF